MLIYLEEQVKERTAALEASNRRLAASEKDLEERLKFETILAEISAHFVNLPAEHIDREITKTQRRVSELLNFDRSSLWQISDRDPEKLLLTHIHQPQGSRRPPRDMDARDFFPWSTGKIMKGEIIIVSRMEDLPPEARRDRESWSLYTTKSSLVFPLSTGGHIFGALSFAMVKEERTFQPSIVKRLRLVAELFASALARKNADSALREAAERLTLATNAAGAALWVIELDTHKVWTTEKTRELFQLDQDKEPRDEDFIRMIHPGDRRLFNQDLRRATLSGKELQSESRISLANDESRWILSRGRGYFKSNGKPDRLMGVSVDITERKKMELLLKEHIREIEHLKERLHKENIYLKGRINLLDEHSEIIGQSHAMRKVLAQVEQVAGTDSTALILGDTGTGKELLARAIHRLSNRKERPLVSINCASLPPTLIESELFGREKGAYTGALTKMVGRFEIANGSTLFLDEIGEIPLDIQSKLLRVLEEGKFERLGSTNTLHVDVRIIAATNRYIAKEVQEGSFRKDLFYRLNVFPIVIPPLRDRREDIPLMVWSFVREFQKRMGKTIEYISKQDMDALQSYSWPGNVRELRNVIERAMILSRDKTLAVHVPRSDSPQAPAISNLEETERHHIMGVLDRCGWRIGGEGGAADVLGLKRSTLYSKMNKLGINRKS